MARDHLVQIQDDAGSGGVCRQFRRHRSIDRAAIRRRSAAFPPMRRSARYCARRRLEALVPARAPLRRWPAVTWPRATPMPGAAEAEAPPSLMHALGELAGGFDVHLVIEQRQRLQRRGTHLAAHHAGLARGRVEDGQRRRRHGPLPIAVDAAAPKVFALWSARTACGPGMPRAAPRGPRAGRASRKGRPSSC